MTQRDESAPPDESDSDLSPTQAEGAPEGWAYKPGTVNHLVWIVSGVGPGGIAFSNAFRDFEDLAVWLEEYVWTSPVMIVPQWWGNERQTDAENDERDGHA